MINIEELKKTGFEIGKYHFDYEKETTFGRIDFRAKVGEYIFVFITVWAPYSEFGEDGEVILRCKINDGNECFRYYSSILSIFEADINNLLVSVEMNAKRIYDEKTEQFNRDMSELHLKIEELKKLNGYQEATISETGIIFVKEEK